MPRREPLPEAVREELERILASPEFSTGGRQSRLLRFLVEETLAGRGPDIKEYTVGLSVFDRDPAFDPRTDSIVRVEASRLRGRLRQFYNRVRARSGVRIELLPGSYVPVFLALSPLRRRLRRAAPWAAVLLVVAVLAATLWWSNRRHASYPLTSIAVLPFTNLTGSLAADHLGDSIAGEVITALTRTKRFRVAARSSAFRFRDRRAGLAEVARALRVGAVIQGSYQTEPSGVTRVTVQLIPVSTGAAVWAQSYDAASPDVAADVARHVSAVLNQPLGQAPNDGGLAPEAWGSYLRGRFLARQRDSAAVRAGIGLLQDVMKEHPSFGAARSAYADAHVRLLLAGERPPAASMAEAEAAARRAIELDGRRPDAYTALAGILMFDRYDWRGSEPLLRHAIELNPQFARAHHLYALGLASRRRFKEAFDEMQTALELDPLSDAVGNDLGAILYSMGRYELARRQSEALIQADPNASARARLILAISLVALGQTERALAECRKAAAIESMRAEAQAREAYVLVSAGRRAEAVRLVAGMPVPTGPRGCLLYGLAQAALGRKTEAIDHLEKAFDGREPLLVFLDMEPSSATLRDDPRFERLRERLGF